MIKIIASLLDANIAHLEKLVKRIEKAGADGVHIDIMDGHCVNNFSFGPSIIYTIRKLSHYSHSSFHSNWRSWICHMGNSVPTTAEQESAIQDSPSDIIDYSLFIMWIHPDSTIICHG